MTSGGGVKTRLLQWLDARTGFRAARHVLLDEEIPAGTGLDVHARQRAPRAHLDPVAHRRLPDALLRADARPCVRQRALHQQHDASGRLVRGLHHFGASFLVVFLVLHLLRVVVLGSYKPPREITWLSGLALMGLVLAFALTGYLLPWDQRAYWATVVTINISRLAPIAGEAMAARAPGRLDDRRADAHALVLRARDLPAGAAGGIDRRASRADAASGQLGSGASKARHAVSRSTRTRRSATRSSSRSCFVAVVAMAWRGMPPLEGPADPTDANYIPRPEWYFLGLFQLLKYFPGKWEVVGAIVLPGVVAALLALLPWIDRGP